MRGKGYSAVCVDRRGVACSLETPCPLLQVRRAASGPGHLHCVNCYQLPTLLEADRRKPDGKRNALARKAFLDAKLAEPLAFDVADMKAILRHHGKPSVCRHGGDDMSHTHYSMIGLPHSGRVLYVDAYPCEGEYAEVKL